MKYTIIIIAALLFGINNTSFATENAGTIDKFTVMVDGLGCPFCAYGLEKKFKEFKGIKEVNIEMETGKLTFDYPTDKKLNIERVSKQVELAGYTPVSVEVLRANGSVEKTETTVTEISEESEIKETEFQVAGNCGMCQVRIERAATKVAGVTEASWDVETQLLSVNFDASQTSADEIAKVIATSGHDTATAKARTKTYKKLPGCCQYERLD